MDVAGCLGNNIARLRREAGLSQEDLAIRASVHRTEISQLERGLRLARIDTLIKLAGSLGSSPAELLDGIRWEPGEHRPGYFARPDTGGSL